MPRTAKQTTKKAPQKPTRAPRAPEQVTCGYCHHPAVATRETPRGPRPLCTIHKAAAQRLGHETESL